MILMKPVSSLATILLALLFTASSMAGCIFESDDPEPDSNLEAIFDWTPITSIQASTTKVFFNGSASIPNDGSLIYRWDFNGDGDIDASLVAPTNTYANPGTFVVTLTVTDGFSEHSKSKEIVVIPKDAVKPIADAGSLNPHSDCDGGEAPTGTVQGDEFYLIYICEPDKDAGDRSTEETTSVTLDGSGSDPGSTNHYITSWVWDLNIDFDSDGNGIEDDDEDATGETYEWTDLPIGEARISLIVTNNEGHTDSMSAWVFVHYKGEWDDLHVNGNTSDNGELVFESTFHYDRDMNNKIKRVNMVLLYPKNDNDWAAGNPEHELNIYMYNSTDEHVINTTSSERGQGCTADEEHVCVSLEVTQYVIDSYEDGDWEIRVTNANYYDADEVEFSIEIQYK